MCWVPEDALGQRWGAAMGENDSVVFDGSGPVASGHWTVLGSSPPCWVHVGDPCRSFLGGALS